MSHISTWAPWDLPLRGETHSPSGGFFNIAKRRLTQTFLGDKGSSLPGHKGKGETRTPQSQTLGFSAQSAPESGEPASFGMQSERTHPAFL